MSLCLYSVLCVDGAFCKLCCFTVQHFLTKQASVSSMQNHDEKLRGVALSHKSHLINIQDKS
jgi:hypothetical protein